MNEVVPDSPNPEVRPRRQRRRFTAKYKLSILERVDACAEAGEVGALLRREGLYSSLLTHWRR
jgi:transposase-like protein